MEQVKKPSKLVVIASTIAAVCFLLSFILTIVSGKRSAGLTALYGFTALLMMIAAVGNWFQYIQRYVQYEIQKKLDDEKSDDNKIKN